MSSSGPPARLLGQAFERCAVEERLRRSSLHYALTGLPTRALFIDRVERALRRGLAEDTAAVLVVGLDRFAGVNNVLGQDAGDAILREVWPGLKEQLAATDTLARVAAEEFAILRIRPLVAGEFELLAAKLIEAVEQPIALDERQMRMTASVGIAVATAGASGAELMCDSATALLQAKDRGGGRAELFNGSIRRQLVARLWMESELRRGIEAGELALVYQPVIATHDRTLVGLEALVRWEHPEWDPVRPDRFLDVAERTELVLPMGAWVLREACAQLAAWSAAFPDRRAPKMSIDVSLRELAEPGYPGRVAAAAEAAGVAPDQLVLELAASRLTPDSRSPVVALEELSSVRLFLDDFGTGSFSLTDLRRLPIDGLKIALPPPSERGDGRHGAKPGSRDRGDRGGDRGPARAGRGAPVSARAGLPVLTPAPGARPRPDPRLDSAAPRAARGGSRNDSTRRLTPRTTHGREHHPARGGRRPRRLAQHAAPLERQRTNRRSGPRVGTVASSSMTCTGCGRARERRPSGSAAPSFPIGPSRG